MEQHALSVVTRMRAGETDNLDAQLTVIGNNIMANDLVRFADMESLHFACWVVLREESAYPPYLILETNFDGPLEAHLKELSDCCSRGLDLVYRHCEGY